MNRFVVLVLAGSIGAVVASVFNLGFMEVVIVSIVLLTLMLKFCKTKHVEQNTTTAEEKIHNDINA